MTPLDQLPKALTGKLLWFFHGVLGRPLGECWALIRPDSTSTAAGCRIIQEVGEKEAEKMRQTALAAGLTGDEPDDE